MGEKIRTMSSFTINGQEVQIELNEGYSKAYSKYDIHIQSNSVQYYLTDKDYMRLASAMATAKRRLDSMKGRSDS